MMKFVGEYSRERPASMDARFVERVERVFESGSEPPSVSRNEWRERVATALEIAIGIDALLIS
jgi:hypothetical protein